MLESEQIERLADFAHEQWSGWMRYLFGKCILNDNGTFTMPARFAKRWSRQVCTPYANLSEEEKESDRKEARKMLDILRRKQMIQLGQRVKDKVTGFTGIAISRIEYLNGCVQYCVKPPVNKDGKMLDGEYIDIQQLEIIDNDLHVESAQTGGTMSDAPSERYVTG